MNKTKDLSIINCISTTLLAYFFTIPVHELFHLLTDYAYGDKVTWFSAGAVQPMGIIDYSALSPFHRIMVAGGSASILNMIIGLLLMLIVLKVSTGPMMRLFLIQFMGTQLTTGIGYFMIGGFFAVGDWGLVFKHLADQPGLVVALRIVLSVVGSLGIVGLFFLLNYMSYYFIEDKNNKKERLGVAFKLHLLVMLIGYMIGITVTLLSPAMGSGELNLGLGLLYNMMWFSFFWGFMFTGPMHTLPPKKSRFLYKLPPKPNWGLFAVSIILILIDIFVLGPGIQIN